MVMVEPGQSAEITVAVTGHPEPVIEWYKNKQMLIPGDKYLTRNVGQAFTLSIANASREDGGKYELTAQNSAGTVATFVDVNVVEPAAGSKSNLPHITKAPVSVQSRAGQRAVLTCVFEGVPMPTAVWFHGGERLTEDMEEVDIRSTETTSELTIHQLTEKTAGEYLITVRNAYGEDLAKAMVMIEGSSAATSSSATTASSPQKRVARR
uniref:Ig-like domain-containing protein n=1 Tax=Plectus sambesii TaxID=2011161 RepID=A0A914WWW9_9BILA